MNNRKLTARQGLFCREYVIDCNAAQAAIRAGYSRRAAKEQGCRLLANARVTKEIARLQRSAAEMAGVRAVDVLLELKKIAFSDVSEYVEYDASGNISLKPSAELPPDLTAAIAEVKQRYDAQGNVRAMDFKLHDKLTALDKLGRHLKLYGDDSSRTGNSDLVVENYGPTLILNGPWAKYVKDGTESVETEPVGEADRTILASPITEGQ